MTGFPLPVGCCLSAFCLVLATAGTARAGLDPCVQPAANCQLPDESGHGALGTYASSSDPSVGPDGYYSAEDFSPLADASVSGICWWGVYVDEDFGADCGPGGGDSFVVTYYENGPLNVPGAVLAGPFAVTAVRQPTGNSVLVYDEYEYSATHEAVPVAAGSCYWVEIQNSTGTRGCHWLWSTSPGDGFSVQDVGDGYDANDVRDYDLALCLDIELATDGCGPPPEHCDGDTNGDLDVDVNDLNNVILDWGTNGAGHNGDLVGQGPDTPPDGIVDVNDLNAVIVAWGSCPLPE